MRLRRFVLVFNVGLSSRPYRASLALHSSWCLLYTPPTPCWGISAITQPWHDCPCTLSSLVRAGPVGSCPPPAPHLFSSSIHQSCHAQQMSGLCAKCQEAPKGTNWWRVTIVMAFWKSRLPIEQDVLCSFRSRFSIYPTLIMEKKENLLWTLSTECIHDLVRSFRMWEGSDNGTIVFMAHRY